MARTASQIDARLTDEILRRAEADKALDAKIAGLDARLKLLEKPPTTPATEPPVVTPPARTILVGAGQVGYTAKAGDVIDGWTITGPGDQTYDGKTVGLLIKVPGVTVRNCRISGFGDAGIRLDGASGFLIELNTITDCAYAGIITTGCTTGRITDNTIQRIGTRGRQKDANAYGITLSMWAGDKPSADIRVEDNVVEDVPAWHGMDTHGGQRIQFVGNTTRRCARPIFITANLESEVAVDCEVRDNVMSEPKAGIPGGTDANSAITLYKAKNVRVVGNQSPGYPTAINNIGGLSTVVTT